MRFATFIKRPELWKTCPVRRFLCHFKVEVKMSSSSATTTSHIERTSDKPREPHIHKVIVSTIENLSPTVKQVRLQFSSSPPGSGPFNFNAGQWVDLFVPGIEKIGGFTISSSPNKLKETQSLDLAIQYSDVQPAFWVHTQCKVNSEVSVRVGGDFFFDPDKDNNTEAIVLIAGGVGINPLASIIKQIHESNDNGIPTFLLYSAKTTEELLFREDFELLATKRRNFTCRFFVTKQSCPETGFSQGRIAEPNIVSALAHLDKGLEKLKVFICGPPPMIEVMEEIVRKLSLKDIAYEKWW